jgi:hypothetical protein
MDLGEFLPPGDKTPKGTKLKVSLREFLEPEVPKEPEIFSDPIALEVHISRTICHCGQEFISPEGVFAEVVMKRLQGFGYREVGHVLIPLTTTRSKKLASIPHRIRTRESHQVACHMCIDRTDLYEDPKVETYEEWVIKRPPILSEAWKRFQFEVNPSAEKLRELIRAIEYREHLKDSEAPIQKPTMCDPEAEREE